ncbi:TIGR03571 family LLM class oxidoreductase [Pseudomonas chlororaphis]|uniref:TIGR03571 family LLM class oxidoreductase n=1 Tax=Pseudomonas chlororaphis TaxID=587753 RepID=UPI001E29CC66|nr:TIGR03571 family LLM class oxidoreductase [Pseudomonas chlororaphis]MCB2250966.1 TIGR03571 family LLM class oxidoreductase [Pseudomonas chlororaphis]
MHPRFHRLLGEKHFSIGLELPLDNDWSSAGQRLRQDAGRPFGVPDLKQHANLARLADQAGFRALWVRDVPVYDPDFGDAAQVFETFSYLGYLAGITQNILLGTAAVVLPLRQPWLTLKAANSVDELSDGRLLLGVASGDRPMEYPLFGVDYAQRGALFRNALELLRSQGQGRLPPGAQLLPQRPEAAPLLVAGLGQQSPAWIGEHMDAWLAYPGTPEEHRRRVALWREVGGDKPYISFLHLDLAADPQAPMQRLRFGGRCGRLALIDELQALREAGVQHVGLHLRRSGRPVAEVIEEISQHILPRFHDAN